jgi:hypothetical protein
MPWSKKKGLTTYSRNNSTAWQKMSKTSKRWWNRTTELLDPYPEPKPLSASDSKSESGWFSGWFGKKDERKFDSVNDFLSQPIPK